MATEIERHAVWPRVSWSAVIAGTFFALATHMVLGLFGIAWGFRVDPADPTAAIGIGAAAWGVLVPFVASLIGALVAVRLAGARTGAGAGIHGLLTWCIGLAVGGLFITGTLAENFGLGAVAREGLAAVDITPAALAAGIGAVAGLIGAVAGVLIGRKQMEGERTVVAEPSERRVAERRYFRPTRPEAPMRPGAYPGRDEEPPVRH